MAGIRVNSGVLRIEVNDKGDTIALRKDMGFIDNIVKFADGLGTLQAEYQAKANEMTNATPDEQIELLYNFHKELHDGLEMLFGAGTCKKVFGDGEVDVIPSLDSVSDFFEQLTPYVKKLAQEMSGKQANKVVTMQRPEPVAPVGYMGHRPERSSAFNSLRQQLGTTENAEI